MVLNDRVRRDQLFRVAKTVDADESRHRP